MKTCRVCKQEKEDTDFYLCKRKGGNPEARHTECKACAIERVKAAHAADPDKARDRHYRRAYGLSLEQVNRMIEAQGNQCACCPATKPGGKHDRWNVDHDHVTGAVRQLLCKDCNIVLGIVKDSTEHLQRLTEYVLRHSPHNLTVASELYPKI